MNSEAQGNDVSKGGDGEKPDANQPPNADAADQTSDEESQGGARGEDGQTLPMKREGGDYSNLERLRKQKRLAMNRASARNRRRQKKEMLETLEKQVDELRGVNQGLLRGNQTLTSKVEQLEGELTVARSTIAVLTSGGGSQSAASAAPPAAASPTAAPTTATSTLSAPTAAALAARLSSLLPAGTASAAASALHNAANPGASLASLLSPSEDLMSQLAVLTRAADQQQQGVAVAQAQTPQLLPPQQQHIVSTAETDATMSLLRMAIEQQGLQNLLVSSVAETTAVTPAATATATASMQAASAGQEANVGLEHLLRTAGDSISDPSVLDQLRRLVGGTTTEGTADARQPQVAQQPAQAQTESREDMTSRLVAMLAPVEGGGANPHESKRPSIDP